MELVTGLEHQNIHLTVDNWYSSIKLIEDLLVIKGITTTCTMKKNAAGMPTDFKIASKSLRMNESIFCQKNRMILSAYRDKVIVGCISTLCSNCITIQDRKRGNPRPESIAIYNRLMKGLIILIKILVIMDTHIDS